MLSVYETCTAPDLSGLLRCSDGPRSTDDEILSFPVTGGLQYFLVVDGYRAQDTGTFDLTVELAP